MSFETSLSMTQFMQLYLVLTILIPQMSQSFFENIMFCDEQQHRDAEAAIFNQNQKIQQHQLRKIMGLMNKSSTKLPKESKTH